MQTHSVEPAGDDVATATLDNSDGQSQQLGTHASHRLDAAKLPTGEANTSTPLPYQLTINRREDSAAGNSQHDFAEPNPSSPRDYSRLHDRGNILESRSHSPTSQIASFDGIADDLDDATKAAIFAAQNEHGTRVRMSKSTGAPDHPNRNSSPLAQSPVPTLPRQTPKSRISDSSAKKPVSKKRRLNTDGTRKAVQRSSISATPRSASPANALMSGETSEVDSDIDETELYCICRRPDDHTWMIACDGCEDWFHGKCVNIPKEDEGLVDNFYCPNCDLQGKGHTTWKAVCRYGPCRNPARLKRGQESKYCSDSCGSAFMKEQLRRVGNISPESVKKQSVEHESEIDLGPLGGRLRSLEVQALANASITAENFHKLGSMAAITPPPSVTVEEDAADISDNKESTFTSADLQRLQEIQRQKEALRHRRALLKEKEAFVTMVKDRAKKAAEVAKVKDQCGFDSRLSWDDWQFECWRYSAEGVAAFRKGELSNGSDSDQLNEGLCTRRRCNRHSGWQKLVLHDVRFEEADGVDEMRRIDLEEQSIRLRAARRAPSRTEDFEVGTVEMVG